MIITPYAVTLNKMQWPGRCENMHSSSKISSLDEHPSQMSTETTFDVCGSSNLSLLHLSLAICHRKSSLKWRGSELGTAFIHTHSTPLNSLEDPLPLAGSVCGSQPTDPTELSISLGARTSKAPRVCSATWNSKRTCLGRQVTDAADLEEGASAWQVTRDETQPSDTPSTEEAVKAAGTAPRARPASSTARARTNLSPRLLFLN